MSQPYGFSWIEKPSLAASSMPTSEEELAWLRAEGIDIVLSLTESPLPRRWIDEGGLMNVHVPIADMSVPYPEDIEKCLAVIRRAKDSKMGLLVHCLAGRGRTGTVLGLHFVSEGMKADEAVERVRTLRPGSIETDEQRDLIRDYARQLGTKDPAA